MEHTGTALLLLFFLIFRDCLVGCLVIDSSVSRQEFFFFVVV